MKFTTPVSVEPLSTELALTDRIMVLGSCFADNIGQRMADSGFNVCVNPFGTLYNPASIASAIDRLSTGIPFVEEDCIPMGAGAGKICSFEHHTSFAKADAEEFLKVANSSLREASSFWKSCNKVLITFGTAMVWRHDGRVVSNCLKRPAGEFTHNMLSLEEISACIERITALASEGKGFVFTVSPIRHLGDGARVNTLSKASLQLAVSRSGFDYFPAYEIMMDELRDYRFYAEDLLHPSRQAVEYIYEKFRDAAFRKCDLEQIASNEKRAIAARHRCHHSAPSSRAQGMPESASPFPRFPQKPHKPQIPQSLQYDDWKKRVNRDFTPDELIRDIMARAAAEEEGA